MNQAEKQFRFDLQMFAEDVPTPEAPEAAAPAQEPAPAQPDSAPEPERHISEMTDEEQTEYIKRRFLDEDEPPQKPEAAPAQEPGQGATQPEQQPEEPTFEITVNGEKKQVTQSELISLAQKGEDLTQFVA